MLSHSVSQTEAVIGHHLQSVMAKDLEAILSDYTGDSILLTPNGPLQGLEDLRTFFTGFLALLTPEFIGAMKMERQDVVGEYVYLLWSAGPAVPLGTDTLQVRDGKIMMQTFAMYAAQ